MTSIAVLFTLGCAAYFLNSYYLTRPGDVKGQPAIEFSPRIDLGDREIGEQIRVPIAISNNGGSVLRIWNVRTNCSCSGLEQLDSEDRSVRIESLELGPGERAQLAMRVVVRGQPGARLVNLVQFQTNDRRVPEAQISVEVPRVLGGAIAIPAGFFFGTVLVGNESRQIIDIRDLAAKPRKIASVKSSDPDSVTVRLVDHLTRMNGQTSAEGTLIGCLELVVNTAAPRPIAAKVQLELDRATVTPDAIAVSGRVASPVEASPASLILPRNSASGLVYEANCIVRSIEVKEFSLSTESIPTGLSVELLEATEGASSRIVRIRWDRHEASQLAGAAAQQVRLRTTIGGKTGSLVIPVTCLEVDR